MTLHDELGAIDIYLLDQILRGRLRPGMRVFDAGCGTGRNLVYLLRHDFAVCASDADADAVMTVQRLAETLAPGRLVDVRHETIEATSFPDASADVVVASAVLHFARDPTHFDAMLSALWRVLRPGGLLFARLASLDGLGDAPRPLGHGRYVLPDGSTRYLIDAQALGACTARLGGTLADPLKTTIVHGQRAMATWVVRKPS